LSHRANSNTAEITRVARWSFPDRWPPCLDVGLEARL
jgi:hypothetical protein